MAKARVPIGPPRVARRAWLLATGALIAAGCAREDIEIAPRSGGITTVVGVETTREHYCEGHGPPLTSRTGASCDPSLAPIFGHALCTCGDATFTAPVRADAFDSRDGPYVAPESGADIGINGQLFTTAAVNVRGALRVTGGGVLSIVAPFHIEHDFATRSDLAVTAADMSVGGDLWVDGELIAVAPFNVAGDLRQSSGHAQPAGVAIGGDYVSADFALPLPCPCGEAELLDIAALVAAGTAASDHPALDIAGDAPYALAEGDALELPCGRFAFAGGYIAPGTAVTARGRAALFVDGDLAVGGSLGADLRAGDELDVFVGGRAVDRANSSARNSGAASGAAHLRGRRIRARAARSPRVRTPSCMRPVSACSRPARRPSRARSSSPHTRRSPNSRSITIAPRRPRSRATAHAPACPERPLTRAPPKVSFRPAPARRAVTLG